MFEIVGLVLLVGIGGAILLALGGFFWVAKVTFKIALVPIAVALVLLKLVLGVIFVVGLLTIGLPLLVLALALAPLVLLGMFFWGGFHLVSAAI